MKSLLNLLSESIRLRTLCEREEHYQNGIKNFKSKCLKSCFNEKLVEDMINITKMWKERFPHRRDPDKQDNNKISISNTFSNRLELSNKEKYLNPKALVTYKRPTTISGYLTSRR